jgi:hypothetical protein
LPHPRNIADGCQLFGKRALSNGESGGRRPENRARSFLHACAWSVTADYAFGIADDSGDTRRVDGCEELAVQGLLENPGN